MRRKRRGWVWSDEWCEVFDFDGGCPKMFFCFFLVFQNVAKSSFHRINIISAESLRHVSSQPVGEGGKWFKLELNVHILLLLMRTWEMVKMKIGDEKLIIMHEVDKQCRKKIQDLGKQNKHEIMPMRITHVSSRNWSKRRVSLVTTIRNYKLLPVCERITLWTYDTLPFFNTPCYTSLCYPFFVLS